MTERSQETGQPGDLMTVEVAAWKAPLPPPETLRKYEEVVPGGAKLIFEMWQTQSQHRQSLENKGLDAKIKNESRGQIFGFIVALVVILGGLILIGLGKSVEGLAAVIGALGALAGVFVYAKKQQRRELVEKLKPFEAPVA